MEFNSDWSTVHQDVPLDHTSSLSTSQHVQKRSLSCSGSTHESGECTRLDITINVGEELSLATLDRHVIVEFFPCKRRRLHLQRAEILFQLASVESLFSLGKSVVEFLELLGGFVVNDNVEVVSLLRKCHILPLKINTHAVVEDLNLQVSKRSL